MTSDTKVFAAGLQLLLAAATAAANFPPVVYSGFYNPAAPQLHYVSTVPMVAYPVVDPSRSAKILPCPSEGFFPHPVNCSRFYRCVDFAGTGRHFSKYEFQCPRGQRFVAVGKNTCVPGDCEEDGAAGKPVPPTGAQSDWYPPEWYPTDLTGSVHIPPGDDPNASLWPDAASVGGGSPAVPPPGGVYPQPGQVGAPGIPPSPVPVDVSQPAPGGGGAYPQPGVGSVVPGAGGAGVWPQPGPGAGTGGGAGPITEPGTLDGGAYPQPGVGTGSGAAGPGGVGSGPPTGTETSPGSGTVPGVGGAYPQPGAGGGAPSAGGAGGGHPGVQPGGTCPARYVQHAQFCNVYEPCPTQGVQYICVTLNGKELVFDQARQMCAFPSDKENVCKGKPMMQPQFRSDISLFDPSATLQQLSVPVYIQDQEAPSLYQAPALPYVYQQQQSFPSFSQESTFPIFYHGQYVPSLQQTFNLERVGSSDLGTAFISRPNSFVGQPTVFGR